MNINGSTRLCGLIGNPVEHTLSPVIHNLLAEKLNHNLVYVPFLVEENVAQAIEGGYALNILGLNVTVPYKSQVLPSLKEIDELANKIGAVNTLVRVEGGYKGYNTDMSGLYRGLMSEHIEIKGEQVIVLGAGGAARAVAFMCAYYGAEKIFLLNRTIEKANVIASEVNEGVQRNCVIPMRLEDYKELKGKTYLAIQGTSVGLYPEMEHAIIEEKEFYEMIHTGYDLIYKPSNTKFMKLVKEAGGNAYHGLKMLLFQGIEAYEKWNGVTISDELAALVYTKLKDEMNVDE